MMPRYQVEALETVKGPRWIIVNKPRGVKIPGLFVRLSMAVKKAEKLNREC